MPLITKKLLALTVLFCSLMLQGCQDNSSTTKTASTALPVTTLTAKTVSHPYWIELFGQTEGYEEVEIRPQVTGPIQARLFIEGHPVKKGDTLFTIDPAPFAVAYENAQANTQLAQANLVKANRELARNLKLAKAKAISQKELHDAETERLLCIATLKAAQANEKNAKITLDYTEIKSPVDGIVNRALVNPGTLASANSTLLTTISQTNDLKVRFSVSDFDLHGYEISPDSPVEVTYDNLSKPVPAKVDFTSLQIDPSTGTRALSARLESNGQFLPGQYVTVRLTLGTQENVFLVPQAAVRQQSDGTYALYVLEDGIARLRSIEVGQWSGKNWIVTSGLQPGDQVIIDQIQRLRDKLRVTTKTASAVK